MFRRAFTLVELMIVVAIMMVLAAIAVPQVRSAQLKAKRAEVDPMTFAIRDAEVAYVQAHDQKAGEWNGSFLPGWPGKYKMDWPAGTAADALGVRPDGQVYGAYANWDGNGCDGFGCPVGGGIETCLEVWGISDVDGDGQCYTTVVCGDLATGESFVHHTSYCNFQDSTNYY
jgi:type IV pilus assembly protein PilA